MLSEKSVLKRRTKKNQKKNQTNLESIISKLRLFHIRTITQEHRVLLASRSGRAQNRFKIQQPQECFVPKDVFGMQGRGCLPFSNTFS